MMNNSTTMPQMVARRFPVGLTAGLVLLAILFIWWPQEGLAEVIALAISDAYIQVSTFVGATLFLFYGIERAFQLDLTEKLARAGRWQVPLAALLGALPGCGGAIIVVTRFVSGRLSFGSVLATLTATMGDAAFLLLAKEPLTGLFVFVLGFVVGTLTGFFVDWLHGPDFMRPGKARLPDPIPQDPRHLTWSHPLLEKCWLLLFLPGLLIGLLTAFQIDVDQLLAIGEWSRPASFLGFVAGSLCLVMFLLPRLVTLPQRPDQSGILAQTITDTNFVTTWVVAAFILFEVTVFLFDLDLKSLFSGFVLVTPLLAVLVGFLPGCGPQVVITSLYLAGLIPLSAQLGNAISNDGDALFPALALAPKAAFLATLYSAVPALIIAYLWYFLVEGGQFFLT